MKTVDPNQFSRDAWEANAETWDARMGDEGNDFFKILYLSLFFSRQKLSIAGNIY